MSPSAKSIGLANKRLSHMTDPLANEQQANKSFALVKPLNICYSQRYAKS